MSNFATDFYSLITADPSLNALVDGGIHNQNLVDNWVSDRTVSKWIAYEFNRSSNISCLNGSIGLMTYNIDILVIQREGESDEIEDISSRLISYLQGNEYNNIIDIAFQSDQRGFDDQREIYSNTLNFKALYSE